MAAIAAWNAVYLSQAVEELKKRGEAVPEEYLPHITPLGWECINLIGQYSFTHQSARSLDNLRPLRLPEQEEQVEDELVKAGNFLPSQALHSEKADG
jgi:hypothetical protein